MKKIWIVALAVALMPIAAGAGARSEALKQAESSMLVKGTIETNADGSVAKVAIDNPEKFPAGLVNFVDQQVMAWKFEPILREGKAVRARSPMSIRVVAKKEDEERYSIAIRNASFEGEAPVEGETLTSIKLAPPSYPQSVATDGASGVVYVLVKVGADGRVADSIAEQVNLKTVGTAAQMAKWRKALTDASLSATRKWSFKPPVKGELADDAFWFARVPLAFHMNKKLDAAYGRWEMYIPGPRQTAPWSEENRPGFSPDALAEGGVYTLGLANGPRLLTTLEGG